MMIPGAVYLIINNYIPMTGIVIAFKQFNYGKGIWGSPFIGFKNFEFLFATKDAWIITRNTLLYNVAFIVLGTACAIAVAILLNEIHSSAAKKIYQTTILVPFLISIVVVSYLVYAFLSTESGFLNKTILPALGLEPVSWYTESKYWPFILILVNLWKGLGYNCIIYYATLVGIDRGYYEAAVIDGANRWQTLWKVTIPNVMPSITICTFLTLTNSFKLFDQNLALTGGQPYIIQSDGSAIKTTEMLALNIYNTFYGQNVNSRGTAQAKAVLFFLLVAAIGLIQLRATRKKEVQQ